jgi:hypothetical protein
VRRNGTRHKTASTTSRRRPGPHGALIEHVLTNKRVLPDMSCLEPACGAGHMAKVFGEYFGEVRPRVEVSEGRPPRRRNSCPNSLSGRRRPA